MYAHKQHPLLISKQSVVADVVSSKQTHSGLQIYTHALHTYHQSNNYCVLMELSTHMLFWALYGIHMLVIIHCHEHIIIMS